MFDSLITAKQIIQKLTIKFFTYKFLEFSNLMYNIKFHIYFLTFYVKQLRKML